MAQLRKSGSAMVSLSNSSVVTGCHVCRAVLLASLLVAGCAQRPPMLPSDQHLGVGKTQPLPPADAAPIPAPVIQAPPPPPRAVTPTETYSVVVANVEASELLFALARDAKVNLDIHPGISGTVTLNALNQTLPQLLTRISKQIDMRFELDGKTLVVMPDTPYLKNYRVDYVNLARNANSNVSVATQIGVTGAGVGGANNSGGSGSASGNNSQTSINSTSNNRFWETLVANVRDLLRETDKILPEGSSETVTEVNINQSGALAAQNNRTNSNRGTRSNQTQTNNTLANGAPQNGQEATNAVVRRTTFREAASVIANPETGVLAVRATSRQHEKIGEFLDQVLSSARRQVLIEATIVEVQLSDQYQQGINWGAIRGGNGWSLSQQPLGTGSLPGGTSVGSGPGGLTFNNSGVTAGSSTPSMLVLRFLGNAGSATLAAAVSLLESYGKVKVLSSPKLAVLNNQTALLKVVDNKVYFTVEVTPAVLSSTGTVVSPATYTTTVNSVPVGFVMSVTPQVEENGMVSMNVRPTISRIVSFVTDPNPALTGAANRIPEVQTRELESLLRVQTGNIAIMGGLMQDEIDNRSDGIPGLGDIPVAGNLFKHRNEVSRKTELVIFLRPIVLNDASMEGDLKPYKSLQPQADFFSREPARSTPTKRSSELNQP